MSISILWLPLIILIGALAGFLFRGAQLAKSRKRILYLENEMLSNHAEILRLQQEIVAMEKKDDLLHKSRVVPMKETPSEETPESIQKKTFKK